MTVGEDTELTIDDFVYDPKTNNGNFVTDIKSGIVKTISGKISEKNPDIHLQHFYSCDTRTVLFIVQFNSKKTDNQINSV